MKTTCLLFLLAAAALCVAARPPSAPAARGAPAPRDPPPRGAQVEDLSQQARQLLAESTLQNNKDHSLALETAGRALSLFQAAGDREGEARAYAHIGRCHTAQGDLAEATHNYESALQIWRDLNNPREQSRVLISLGFIDVRGGEWRNSLSHFARAEELLAGFDEPAVMGRLAGGLGDVFNENGLPEKGLVEYERALEYFRRTPDTRDDALTILEIGRTLYLQGDYQGALSCFQHELVAFPPGSLDAAHRHQYLGKVYAATGEHVAALQHFQSALPVYAQAGNRGDEAEVLALMGQVYEQQGRLAPARLRYRRASETFTRLSDRINQSAVDYALGRLELRAGNYGAAEGHLRNSIEVTENIRRVPTSRDLTTAFSATVHERYESYVECLMREHELRPSRGLDVSAFETSELARARSLTELLRAVQTDLVNSLDPEIVRREKSLRRALRAKEEAKVALLRETYRPEDLAELDAELARLEAEYAPVNEAVRAAHPAYGQLTRPAAWDLRSIQERVVADDQTLLLEFLLGADKSYVWAVTRDRIGSYDLPARAHVEAAAGKAYKQISNPPGAESDAETDAALRDLSRMVLSPVAAELKNKTRIIVVADGVLHYIPFQVLTASASADEPAVGAYEVVNAPSASVLGELRQAASRRRTPPKLLAAFGNPVFASNYARRRDAEGGRELASLQAPDDGRRQPVTREIELTGDAFDPSTIQPLLYASHELNNLLDVTAGEETLMASGFDATRERLFGADLSQYAIIHFATHGRFDPKRPEHSGLVLSTVELDGRALNGFVGLQDIYSIRAPVDLVVLSACQTALGKDVRGEGLVGLTRGFMYAGASGVVASLWEVEDKATAELMKRFYGNMLQKGMPPGAALREAQNSIRRNPRWRAPHYWAAFTLQGEYDRPIRQATGAVRPRLKIAAVAGLVTLLLSAAVWWYRRRRHA